MTNQEFETFKVDFSDIADSVIFAEEPDDFAEDYTDADDLVAVEFNTLWEGR